MIALVFCVAGLVAGASDTQILKALGPPLFDGAIIAVAAFFAGRWLWEWVLAAKAAKEWLES